MTVDEVIAGYNAELARFPGVEPMYVLAIFVAKEIDPVCCGDLDPRTYRLDDEPEGHQKHVVMRAITIVMATCAVVETEVLAWFSATRKIPQA